MRKIIKAAIAATALSLATAAVTAGPAAAQFYFGFGAPPPPAPPSYYYSPYYGPNCFWHSYYGRTVCY